MAVRATFAADLAQFRRQVERANAAILALVAEPSHRGRFTCDYCAGVADGLSCVHCGAPRRMASVSASTPKPPEPQNRSVRGPG
jgi:hypothetical protein